MDALGGIGTTGALMGIMTFIKSMANFSKFDGLTGMAKAITSIFTASKGGIGGLTGLITGFKSLASGAGLAKVATMAFQAVLSGLGWGLLIGGIALAVKAWDNYAHATERAIEASKEREKGYKNEIQSMNTEVSSLQGIQKEYDELTSKTKLTVAEMQHLSELKQQIAQISPDLVTG